MAAGGRGNANAARKRAEPLERSAVKQEAVDLTQEDVAVVVRAASPACMSM